MRNTNFFSVDVPGIGVVRFKPDGDYFASILEVKDVLNLSAVKQIRAEAKLASNTQRRLVIMATNRTKKYTGPLLSIIENHPDAQLLRRNVNDDTYQRFEFLPRPWNNQDQMGRWVDISKQEAQAILDGL